jgi:hypothetical protein
MKQGFLSMLTRLSFLLLFILSFYGVAKFCKLQTGSFTISRITSSLSFHPEWETPLEADLDILCQPYTYLAKGAQAFVFASQDGKYVIKFFRHHHMSAPFWIKALPFEQARRHVAKKEAKLQKDFASYKLAYDRFREETGLIFLHLNKTDHLKLKLDLVDKLGIHHPIDLDQYEFLVQRRADLLYPALEALSEEQAKIALTNLVMLLKTRMEKGIFDKDPDLNTNFGLIGTTPIQIDFGRYKKAASLVDKDEIVRITDNLHQWLMARAPKLDEWLKQEIDNQLVKD